MAFNAKGGEPAEPVLSKQSVLTDGVKATAKGGEPAPVRASETGRARNWTMPPLRLEREWRERTNSATIDNRCVEFDRRENQCCAFTMAEILLSLTIIGVVAAITLPSLTGNINERTWNTQRKALYARMSQAVALMPALNGYGTLTEDSSGTVIQDTAAETFVTNGLAKVLKINNICDSEHLPDCGLPDKITPFAGTQIDFPQDLAELNPQNTSVYLTDVPSGGVTTWSYSQINSKAAGFETANGESIAVYYNPRCTTLLAEANDVYAQQKMCANFVYDLNGRKGPNTFGKDIGVISVLYPTDSLVVAPIPHTQDASGAVTSDAISGVCKNQDAEYRMPTKEELASLFFNKNIIGNMNAVRYWSSSLSSSIDEAWYTSFTTGLMRHDPNWPNNPVRCVKR